MSTETLVRGGEQTQRRDTVVVVGAGQNTMHMSAALERLNDVHPVHVLEVGTPLIPVSSDRLHMTNTAEGLASSRRLLGSGACRAAYLSVVPVLHERFIREYLGYVAEGEVDFVVIPKPAVRDVEEMRAVDKAVEDAKQRRHERGADSELPPLLVHEHYIEKGAWSAMRERLGSVTSRLGRLETAVFDIQEARTAEDEGRTVAFAGGALEDLAPHLVSLGLDVQESINKTGINGNEGYTISNVAKTTIDRVRYEGSELPEGIETGFIVRGTTKIRDRAQPDSPEHDVKFIWQGGKGFIDSKRATLTFRHPETDICTRITVDLRRNSIDIPPEVQDLFPETQFEDNGYGAVVERGLNGGNPEDSFQAWEQAKVVTKWMHVLGKKGDAPRVYPRGVPLQDLAILYT